MDKKKRIELYRKSIHISSLIFPLSYRYLFNFNKKLMILSLLPLALTAIIIEVFRLEHKTFKRVFYRVFGIMLRRHEISDLTGASYLMTSIILAIAIFPRNIAFCAISFLAVGDTFAAIFGISFGKRKILSTKKSLEGSLACFITTLIFALAFSLHPVIAVVGALSATIAEVSNISVDDNVKIPLISGIAMSLVYIFV